MPKLFWFYISLISRNFWVLPLGYLPLLMVDNGKQNETKPDTNRNKLNRHLHHMHHNNHDYVLFLKRFHVKFKNCSYHSVEINFLSLRFYVKSILGILEGPTVWKSRQKHDHCFCRKIYIFSVKSTLLRKKLLMSWFHGNFLALSLFKYFPTLWSHNWLLSRKK